MVVLAKSKAVSWLYAIKFYPIRGLEDFGGGYAT